MSIYLAAYSLLLAVLLTGAQALFKIFAITRNAQVDFGISTLFPLGGALGLYFCVFLLYAQLLRRFELSLLYPSYTAVSVLLTYVAGVVFFHEPASARAGVGCLLLIVALYLIASSGQVSGAR